MVYKHLGTISLLLLSIDSVCSFKLFRLNLTAGSSGTFVGDFMVGGQVITLSVGTTATSTMLSNANCQNCAKGGYDPAKSKTSANGTSIVPIYTLPSYYLPTVNDRIFRGATYFDVICPYHIDVVCPIPPEKKLEMFVIDAQISGDQISNQGRMGLDYDKNSLLWSFSYFLQYNNWADKNMVTLGHD